MLIYVSHFLWITRLRGGEVGEKRVRNVTALRERYCTDTVCGRVNVNGKTGEVDRLQDYRKL